MKNFPLILVLFLVSGSIFGQLKPNLSVGLIVGPNRSTINGSFEMPFNKPSTHYCGGIYAEIDFSKRFSLCTNLLYERIGTIGNASNECINLEYGTGFGDYTAHVNFDYIVLPLLIKMSIGNRVKYFFNIGPNISYLLGQKTMIDWEHFETGVLNDQESYKRVNFGISSGLGLTIPLSYNLQFNIEFRNNLGVYDINALTSLTKTIRTNSVTTLFSVAYKIDQKRFQYGLHSW